MTRSMAAAIGHEYLAIETGNVVAGIFIGGFDYTRVGSGSV
jgi:hypothetical protein